MVGIEPAWWYSGLIFVEVPYDNVSIFRVQGLAGAGCNISLACACDTEYLKDVTIQFLLLWPKSASHEYIFNRWLSNCDQVLCFLLVWKNGNRIEFSTSTALFLFIYSHTFVGQEHGWFVHQTKRLLFRLLLDHRFYLLIGVLRVKPELTGWLIGADTWIETIHGFYVVVRCFK